MNDIKITIIDRDGVAHEVDAPTDMNMNVILIFQIYAMKNLLITILVN